MTCGILKNKVVDPAFRLMRFPLDGELDFDFEKWFYWLRKIDLESPLIFVLFLKGNKIRKKTLSATPYFGKDDLRKTGSGSRVKLLIRKVRL